MSGPAEPDASGAGDIVRIETALPNGQPDPGVITTPDASTASDELIAAISKHRHYARETDPPRV